MTRPPPEGERGTCVLIVDDDQNERDSLRDVVEMLGLSACVAANAEDALALLADFRPCLVILDVLMPGMTAPRCSRRCNGTPGWRCCPC